MDREELFEQLMRSTRKLALRSARYLTKNEEEAQDLVQEATIRALDNFHLLKTTDRFPYWFLKVMRNMFLSKLRRRNLELVELTDLKDTKDWEIELVSNASISQIIETLNKLSPEKRLVSMLYFVEGKKASEIAAFLGVSEITVKTRIFRARKELKKSLWELAINSNLIKEIDSIKELTSPL